MPDKAHVTSVEALESFRASLITYLSKARPTLEEVSAELMRTRLWLENEQRTNLEGQMRRRTKAHEQAQQALSSARFSNLREPNALEVMAVQKARRAVEEGEAKLRLCKQWDRDFDNRVQPLGKELEKLQTVLSNDMMQAAAYLAKTIATLSAYAEVAPPSALAAPGPLPEPIEGGTPATPGALPGKIPPEDESHEKPSGDGL
jgi:hypothetical protein